MSHCGGATCRNSGGLGISRQQCCGGSNWRHLPHLSAAALFAGKSVPGPVQPVASPPRLRSWCSDLRPSASALRPTFASSSPTSPPPPLHSAGFVSSVVSSKGNLRRDSLGRICPRGVEVEGVRIFDFEWVLLCFESAVSGCFSHLTILRHPDTFTLFLGHHSPLLS